MKELRKRPDVESGGERAICHDPPRFLARVRHMTVSPDEPGNYRRRNHFEGKMRNLALDTLYLSSLWRKMFRDG